MLTSQLIQNLPFPLVNSPFYKSSMENHSLTSKELSDVEHYRKYGYVIIEDCVADKITANRIHQDCDAILPGYGKNRVQDAWTKSEAVKSVATNEKVLHLLKVLYGREPVPVQTLNFIRGTQQKTHSDFVHFSSVPAGFMCGAWTALEDITINQGPLHYYPESHTLPEFDYYDLGIGEEHLYPNDPQIGASFDWKDPRTVEKYKLYEDTIERLMLEHSFKREALTIKAGQTLIWAANLFHGGNEIVDAASTRKSQVTHFQFEGTIPWTPRFSNRMTGDYHIQGLLNIRTGTQVVPTYNFMPVDLIPMSSGLCKIRIKSGNAEKELQSFLTQEYSEALASARAENALLRQRLEDVTGTRLWKAMQPIREITHRIKAKR